MKASNLLFVASWVILIVVSSAIAVLSLQSLRIAYTSNTDSLTRDYTLNQVQEQGGDEAVKAFKGRRATAATWALAYSLLAIAVIWIPYRRGEKWAWWALLVALGVSQLLSIARAIMLVTAAGFGAASIILVFTLIGLMAGAPRMFGRRGTGLKTGDSV